jgi:prepilin-type N-terminal cleavage/methylation domain-containing protein
MQKRNNGTSGFTLIELLVVVVLIGILSGVLLGIINIGGIRAKTRDAQRAGDLKKIQTALELYFADNRSYIDSSGWKAVSASLVTPLQTTGKYINKMPSDPVKAGTAADSCSAAATDHDYWYVGTAGAYILATNVEVATSASSNACGDLNNWADIGCGDPAPANCYGVENPF